MILPSIEFHYNNDDDDDNCYYSVLKYCSLMLYRVQEEFLLQVACYLLNFSNILFCLSLQTYIPSSSLNLLDNKTQNHERETKIQHSQDSPRLRFSEWKESAKEA